MEKEIGPTGRRCSDMPLLSKQRYHQAEHAVAAPGIEMDLQRGGGRWELGGDAWGQDTPISQEPLL